MVGATRDEYGAGIESRAVLVHVIVMVRRILLALGRERDAPTVIRRGIELAHRYGAELSGVVLTNPEYWKGPSGNILTASEAIRLADERPWDVARQRSEVLATQFADSCRSANIPSRIIHPSGDPLESLVSEGRYHDLLIFGLHGLFDTTIVPDSEAAIAWLIRQGISPVLGVGREYRDIRRVMIVYSGSTQSADAMKRFVQMRPWPDAAVQIVVFEKDPTVAGRLLESAKEYCVVHGIEPEPLKSDGIAQRDLLSVARHHDADLLVLADSYRNLLLHETIGDTTRDVVRNADRPVFLTH